MRVLTFTSLFPNPARPDLGIFIYQRMAHFANRAGNTVYAIAPIPYCPKWVPMKRWRQFSEVPRKNKIGHISVFHPRYPLLPALMPLHGMLMFLGTISLARRLHRQEHFDCIDAHYVYPDSLAAVLIGRILRVPVVVSARGTDINVFPSLGTIRPMIKWVLRHAAGVVAVSASLKTKLLKLGLLSRDVQVIGNGVDLKRFYPIDRRRARAQLGLPEEGKILVAVGSLLPVKGFQYLLPAFAAIGPNFPEAQLYIVGTGPYRKHLERLVHELRLEKRVSLVGARPNEQLRLWFNAANLACLTSLREGWPNVLLESLACGTPVVATSVDGVPEVIVSEDLGFLTSQKIERIAECLERALYRDWDRTKLTQYAAQRSWDVVADELEKYLLDRTTLRYECNLAR